MGKKKWTPIEERTDERSKCEIRIEEMFKENGFNIKACAWYNEFTDYLVEKDSIEMVFRHFRGRALQKRLEAEMVFYNDYFEMKKKILEKGSSLKE